MWLHYYDNLDSFEKQVRHYKLYFEDGYHYVGKVKILHSGSSLSKYLSL